MIRIRSAQDRGTFDFGWLKTAHSFSFGDYHDPAHMGFSDLRVINQDYMEPGQGFAAHPHKDMEIITYVLKGALAHKDSVGNEAIIRRGEVQRMSAGSGITHSEFNASQEEGVEFLQIWIVPDREGHVPGYEQKPMPKVCDGELGLIASLDGREGAVQVNQDSQIYAGRFIGGEEFVRHLSKGRRAWVQVAKGEVLLNRASLKSGDGAAVDQEDVLRFQIGEGGAEILVFDLR